MRRSDLAVLAPPGGAVGIALAARADAAVAADAGAAVLVDGEGLAAARGDSGEHLVAGQREDEAEVVVAHFRQRAPGVEPSSEAGLALEDVADPGDQALIEQGVAEGARRVARAEAGGHPVEVDVVGEEV